MMVKSEISNSEALYAVNIFVSHCCVSLCVDRVWCDYIHKNLTFFRHLLELCNPGVEQ